MKIKQIVYQIYYKLRKKIGWKVSFKKLDKQIRILLVKEPILNATSFTKTLSFNFLNKTKVFESTIDWNFSDFGKLWTYNLNYFDFLNQENISKEDGLALIQNYIRAERNLKDGKEPYPISLRGINWIKFLSKHNISDAEINQILYHHYQILSKSREFHLLGNHILENGFSLLVGAYYFQDSNLLTKAQKILNSELNEQLLDDGGHFELSPMYHQIMLHRILDCLNIVSNNDWQEFSSNEILESSAKKMLGWLEAISYNNGSIPMVNDSTGGIAPTSEQLFNYARRLGLNWNKSILKDSGYRKWIGEKYEMLMDVGEIGPNYIPGHAHADSLSFELMINGNPLIVDTGISTYEKNKIRHIERSTVSHNTVVVNECNSSNVWSGFRVAQRAKVIQLLERENEISAEHDGYHRINVRHKRTFRRDKNSLFIKDEIKGESNVKAHSLFHFHPNAKEIKINQDSVELLGCDVKLKFVGKDLLLTPRKYEFCDGFNKRIESIVLYVSFESSLLTTIDL